MHDPTDEDLIEKSKNGDIESFKTLVTRKERKVATLVIAMLGEPSLSEDVGQEVFIRLYDSLDKVRDDDSVDTFVVRLAAEYSLDVLKRRKKTPHLDLTQQVKDLNEQFQFEFSSLDPENKLITTLRLVAGYSTEEIAELLKLPLSTILSQLAIAQHTLRVTLSNKLE